MKIEKRILLMVILYAGLTAATAYAAIAASKSLTATVTIQSATAGLSIFDYATCSYEQTSVAFTPALGPNPGDQSIAGGLCIKNTGNVNFYIISSPPSVIYSGLPPGVAGTFVGIDPLPAYLPPSGTVRINLILTNDGTAAPGSISFTVTFRGYDTNMG